MDTPCAAGQGRHHIGVRVWMLLRGITIVIKIVPKATILFIHCLFSIAVFSVSKYCLISLTIYIFPCSYANISSLFSGITFPATTSAILFQGVPSLIMSKRSIGLLSNTLFIKIATTIKTTLEIKSQIYADKANNTLHIIPAFENEQTEEVTDFFYTLRKVTVPHHNNYFTSCFLTLGLALRF